MALIHILDNQTDEILDTIDTSKAQVTEPIMTRSIDNSYKFNMLALDKFDLLTDQNRLLVEDKDGFFVEFIIFYANQYARNQKEVRALGSFVELQTAKVIPPQTLTGATPSSATTTALAGTDWKVGNIDFTGSSRTIVIEEPTDPFNLLQVIRKEFDLELSYRVEVDGNRIIGRYVDMVKSIAGFEGKEIEFGKDLISIRRTEDTSNIVTALIGYGPVRNDGTRLESFVEDKDALARWERKGQHLIRPYFPESSDSDMTQARLNTLTQMELKKRISAVVTYECEAVSLETVFGREHERIRLGQTVRIKDDGYTPPLYLEARIREVEENIATGQTVKFILGNYVEFSKADLEKEIAKLRQQMGQKVSDQQLRNELAKTEKVIAKQTNAPSTPYLNQMWIDTSTTPNVLKRWNGTSWIKASPTTASDVGAASPQVVDDKINAIEIGGRNLIRMSSMDSLDGWSNNGGSTVSMANGYLRNTFTDGISTPGVMSSTKINVPKGVYTITAKYNADNLTAGRPVIFYLLGGVGADISIPFPRKSGMTKDSVTFGVTEDLNNKTVYFLTNGHTAGDYIDYDWVKLERGNKPTDQSPAPEDQIQINKQYTNGLLFSELVGLIVERSDGKFRSVQAGTDGFYLERKNLTNWEKVFYADSSGNLMFAGSLIGATGTFSGALNAATGTFKGALSGVTGTFSGDITASNIKGSTLTTETRGEGRRNVFTLGNGALRVEEFVDAPNGKLLSQASFGAGGINAIKHDGYGSDFQVQTPRVTTNQLDVNTMMSFVNDNGRISFATGGANPGIYINNRISGKYLFLQNSGLFSYGGNGLFSGSVTATNWITSSKRELKRDIADYQEDALAALEALRIRTFNYKTDEVGAKRRVGIIVDEATASADVISDGGEGSDVSNTLFLAVKAIHQLYAIVKNQEAKLNEHSTSIAQQNSRMDALEVMLNSQAAEIALLKAK